MDICPQLKIKQALDLYFEISRKLFIERYKQIL